MKLLIDESAGQAVAEFLRSLGHDVAVVAEDSPQAEDTDILQRASAENRIVVTNDKDFGDLVFRSGYAHAGIVLFRLHDESPANRLRMAEIVFTQYAGRLAGHFTVASERRIRIRPAT